MSKFYKQALSLISSGEFDSEKLALRLAQEHPALFVKLLTPEVVQPVVPDWFMRDVVSFVTRVNNPVQAIKNLREKTRITLWEAKQVIDEWRYDDGGDKEFLSHKIGHEIPEWAGKTWADLVKASRGV